MDNLIAIAAAMLYLLSIATIVPGLVNQTGIRAKTVFISAAIALLFHGWLLSDLILHSSGQNLSILNVASLISFIISLAMSLAMFKTRLWFLLPVAPTVFLPLTFLQPHSYRELLLPIWKVIPNCCCTSL